MDITPNKLVFGVGINDITGNISYKGKHIKSYTIWKAMIERCYSSKLQIKRPTYIGCSVCDEWLSFSNFKKWFDENYIEGFELDKDILVEGNKVYSPNTCRFVPQYLNTLLTNNKSSHGLPLGVYDKKPASNNRRNVTTYQALCSNGYGIKLSKTFKTIAEAQEWYSTTKKRIVKEQAIRAFLDNAIKTDVYLALIRREF